MASDMRCWKISEGGEIVLDDLGRPVEVVDDEAAQQNVLMRMRTNRGEWFWNMEFGVPWLDRSENSLGSILGEPVGEGVQQALIIVSEAQEAPGVEDIVDFDFEYEPVNRVYELTIVTDVFDFDLEIPEGPQ